MSLADYQKQIDEALRPYLKPYWSPLSQLARLSEEVGEVARILNHQYGDKPKKPDETHDPLEDELADVIFICICIANSEGLRLDEAMQRAIAKVTTRDKDRFPRKPA